MENVVSHIVHSTPFIAWLSKPYEVCHICHNAEQLVPTVNGYDQRYWIDRRSDGESQTTDTAALSSVLLAQSVGLSSEPSKAVSSRERRERPLRRLCRNTNKLIMMSVRDVNESVYTGYYVFLSPSRCRRLTQPNPMPVIGRNILVNEYSLNRFYPNTSRLVQGKGC